MDMHNSSSRAEQIKSLTNGRGIQNLLNEASAILGNPILIHDMEYKAVAYTQNVASDDPIWNEYITAGTVGYHWLDFFKNECFLEAAANTKSITFLTSDKLPYERIFGKLFNRNSIQVGCAVLTASSKPFAGDDPMLFEEVCAILSAEMGRDEFYTDYGQAYFEKLVGELIAGVDDIALYTAHVESIYMHLKSNLYLAVVDVEKCDPTHARLAYYRDLMKETQPEYMYAIYGNYVLIIIGTNGQALNVEKELSELNRLFRENGICAGISKSFENLFDLKKYYRQALDTLSRGLAITNQRIFSYEQFAEQDG